MLSVTQLPIQQIVGECLKQCKHSIYSSKKLSSIGVHDEKGCLIATDTGKSAVVAECLKKQLTRDELPLEPYLRPPRPLISPVASDEISAVAKNLKNGWSNGPDAIPNVLLKYSSGSVYIRFANIINRSFETNSYLHPIG